MIQFTQAMGSLWRGTEREEGGTSLPYREDGARHRNTHAMQVAQRSNRAGWTISVSSLK